MLTEEVVRIRRPALTLPIHRDPTCLHVSRRREHHVSSSLFYLAQTLDTSRQEYIVADSRMSQEESVGSMGTYVFPSLHNRYLFDLFENRRFSLFR